MRDRPALLAKPTPSGLSPFEIPAFRTSVVRCDPGGMSRYRWTSGTRPVIARFVRDGWPFELFGDHRPVDQQRGWIHFEVERRLLALDGGTLRRAVGKLRADGLKTEPAFAAVLGISGDPYRGLLQLAAETDAELRARLAVRGLG